MRFLRRFDYLLLIMSGVLVIAFGFAKYLGLDAPRKADKTDGISLAHQVAIFGPATYLFGWQSDIDSWTERDGRLDTPLAKETLNEVSTLSITRAKIADSQDKLIIQPKEWILSFKNDQGFKSQTVPLTHPSIAPADVLVDRQGTLLQRLPTPAWRTALTAPFLFPQFPKGPLRKGSTWTEHVEWIETISDWTIDWQADLIWVLKDTETRYNKSCSVLSYTGTLTPSLRQAAAWAGKVGQNIQFTGQGNGDALYNIDDKFLISNTFAYNGTLKIHVPDLGNVPDDLRVGSVLSNGEGDVVLQFKNKIDVRLP